MQKREVWRIAIVVICLMCLFISQAVAEHEAWDCPDCGRTGNTGNYCGGCAHPAPWIESSTDPAPTDPSGNASSSPSVRVGDIITFGTYPQTKEGNDQTPIEWIVLDYDETNHKALVLSRYGLDRVLYYKDFSAITWEKCTLRTWLNGEFLNKAFSAAEQSAILITPVDNSSGQGYCGWNTDGGNNTEDQIFLLSYAEANRYLNVTFDDSNNLKSRVAPTAYALAQGAYTGDSNKTEDGAAAGWWWLRSPGQYQDHAVVVYTDGSLLSSDVFNISAVVRPAFWLDYDFYNKADSSETEKTDASVLKHGETSRIAWQLDTSGTVTIRGSGVIQKGLTDSWDFTGDVTNVMIEEGITGIGDKAFSGFSGIKNVILPNGLKSIGKEAFASCEKMMEIIIPESVETIGNSAFSSCKSLQNVKLPGSVKEIEGNTFIYCSNLKSINIPEGVTKIGANSFFACSHLQIIEIPGSVTQIDEDAFHFCNEIKEIKVDVSNEKYMVEGGILFTKKKDQLIKYPALKEETAYSISDGVTDIVSCAFQGCINLESITIPESVKTIEYMAFQDCRKLRSITIPEGAQICEESIFAQCYGLKEVIIREGVKEIGKCVFCDCTNLKQISIPKSVISIGEQAFLNCAKLKDVLYSGSKRQKDKMTIETGNPILEKAEWHFGYASPET